MMAEYRPRLFYLSAVLFAGCALVVLNCTTKTIRRVTPVPHPHADELVAGSARTDITPPAGYGFFGYSIGSQHVARGFQTRLYARAFYLEEAGGDAVALVQCDIGAVSAMLHHDVARRVAETTGLGPDRILIAATHTHSAPGAHFGSSMYNDFGTREVGFDEGLFDFLSQQIAVAINKAFATRGLATAASGTCQIPGITYNRSFAAHLANYRGLDADPSDAAHAVNKTFTMLRVDRTTDDGTVPLGVFTNFAIHGTSIGGENDLYNTDCFGAAERYLEEAIRDLHEVPDTIDVIHALTIGMAGDVGPLFDRTRRGFGEARRLGRTIAEHAFTLFESLGDALSSEFEIQRAYREISLRHTVFSDNAELKTGKSGFPVMGGTDDGYTPLHFVWPGKEGSRATSADLSIGPVGVSALVGPFSWSGQDSSKIHAGGGLHDHFLPPGALPQMMTLQVFRLGDLLLLAVPGEITTEMGRRVIEYCAPVTPDVGGTTHTMIVALANQYFSYITTAAEYDAQHYEGAHTLWGAQLGVFVRDKLAELITEIPRDTEYDFPDQWTFSPGTRAKFANYKFPAPSPVGVDTVFVDSTLSGQKIARYFWWDEKPANLDLRRLDWRIEVPDDNGTWKTLQIPGLGTGSTMPVDARGLDLSVYYCRDEETKRVTEWMESHGIAEPKCKELWCVEWTVGDSVLPDQFRFALYLGISDRPSIAVNHPLVPGS